MSVGVFGKRHHAGVVGDRSREKLRSERRNRHPVGVSRIPGQRDCHGVSDVAVNSVDRKHTVSQIANVGADLSLVGAVRGVVLALAAELPQGRRPVHADVDTIFQRLPNLQSSVSPTPQVTPCQPIGENAYEPPIGS